MDTQWCVHTDPMSENGVSALPTNQPIWHTYPKSQLQHQYLRNITDFLNFLV